MKSDNVIVDKSKALAVRVVSVTYLEQELEQKIK